jgi:hypothetical protein
MAWCLVKYRHNFIFTFVENLNILVGLYNYLLRPQKEVSRPVGMAWLLRFHCLPIVWFPMETVEREQERKSNC